MEEKTKMQREEEILDLQDDQDDILAELESEVSYTIYKKILRLLETERRLTLLEEQE